MTRSKFSNIECDSASLKAADASDPRWRSGAGLPGILTVGNPKLREAAAAFKGIEGLEPLCDRLVQLLREYKGAGLAAAQIASTEPVVVVEVRKTDLFPDRPESPLYVMIRPRIIELIGPIEEDWEGCFSVPGYMAMVPRAAAVRVNYLSPAGEEKTELFSGDLARVVQHEIDHLNGILFVDLVENPRTFTTVANWLEFHRINT